MVAGYKLRINGGGYSNTEIDVGLVFEYLLTGLTASTDYMVEIAAYDETGEQSEWSSPVTATTDGPPELMLLIDEDGDALMDEDGDLLTELED
jgi:hypothetical protein